MQFKVLVFTCKPLYGLARWWCWEKQLIITHFWKVVGRELRSLFVFIKKLFVSNVISLLENVEDRTFPEVFWDPTPYIVFRGFKIFIRYFCLVLLFFLVSCLVKWKVGKMALQIQNQKPNQPTPLQTPHSHLEKKNPSWESWVARFLKWQWELKFQSYNRKHGLEAWQFKSKSWSKDGYA